MKFNPKFSIEKIRSGRKVKEEALDQNISAAGPNSDRYKESVPPKIEVLINGALEQHREWIEDKLNQINENLPEDSKISFLEMDKVFRTTLENRIKQQAKLNSEKPERWIEKNNLENIFNQAAFDFIQSLKASARRGNTKNIALKLGKKSHILNPNIIEDLQKQYPNVNQSVINLATTQNSKNPKDFLDKYNKKIEELIIKYPDTNQSVINRAALGYPKNSENFINEYNRKISELIIKYPDVNRGVINHAAVTHYKNPESFIDRYNKDVVELKTKYPDVNQGVINHAALNYSKNPEVFINDYNKKIKELEVKYPDVNQEIINRAALNYSKNPDNFIDEYNRKISELKIKYPNINKWIINRIAKDNPADPESYIKKQLGL